jgi:hypothetical protein
MSWILVLYIFAGTFAKGDSVSLVQVPGFTSEAECKAAGAASAPLVASSVKDLRFVCLSQKK